MLFKPLAIFFERCKMKNELDVFKKHLGEIQGVSEFKATQICSQINDANDFIGALQILDLTLKLIEHETKNKITVIKKYSQLPPVYCAVNMLNQVFMNILINACQNIKEYKTEGKIIITTAVSDGCLLVKIKDDGTGIPVEIQSKIFNTGFTTKKTRAGMGLGLAISKKIIEMHKGSITFNSDVGKGTEFIVSVPI